MLMSVESCALIKEEKEKEKKVATSINPYPSPLCSWARLKLEETSIPL